MHTLPVAIALVLATAADAAPPVTSLSNEAVRFDVPDKPYVVLHHGNVRAVVVDNRAVDDGVLPGHRDGYNGVASLTHARRHENLFVPDYAGLNFEFIHDGTPQERDVMFEPRRAAMELRTIDARTAELYQGPTPHWGLESCTRYHLLDDGTIEMTFECIPRRPAFANAYIGLFWASYIHQPESLDIHFQGHGNDEPPTSRWIRGVTPAHGELSTHVGTDDQRVFARDAQFPMHYLIFSRSRYRYVEPWYFGVSHGMAYVLMFRPADGVRLTQSPTGGGRGNPAWDFQFFIPDFKIGKRYQFVLRAMYVPYESHEQIERITSPHRKTLGIENR